MCIQCFIHVITNAVCFNIQFVNHTYTGEPDVQSSPQDVVKDTVLNDAQFFLPGSGLTKKLYFDRYASNIADDANIKSP